MSNRIDYNQRVVDWVEQYASETRRPKIAVPPITGAHWERRLAALAGRVIEKLTGLTGDAALKQKIYALPAGEKYLHFGVCATPKAQA